MSQPATSNHPTQDQTVTVRYQVADVARALDFYEKHLECDPGERYGDAFATARRGNLRLIMSGPGSSGSRSMPDGRVQTPGGWNRVVIYVADLDAKAGKLREAGVVFRNEVEVGPGGKQILIEDPDGNPIELHEAPAE